MAWRLAAIWPADFGLEFLATRLRIESSDGLKLHVVIRDLARSGCPVVFDERFSSKTSFKFNLLQSYRDYDVPIRQFELLVKHKRKVLHRGNYELQPQR